MDAGAVQADERAEFGTGPLRTGVGAVGALSVRGRFLEREKLEGIRLALGKPPLKGVNVVGFYFAFGFWVDFPHLLLSGGEFGERFVIR